MGTLKLIGKFALVIILLIIAIGSSVGLFFVLKSEFTDFGTPHSLGECLFDVIRVIFNLVNYINLFVYALVGASWYWVYLALMELLGIDKNDINHHKNYDSYTSPYMGVDDNYDEDRMWSTKDDVFDDYDGSFDL